MKVIMTGGGTGGHIYPAVAIADKIKRKNPDAEILFVGTEKGMEKELVPKSGYPIRFITVSGFDRKRLWRNVKTLRDALKGTRQANRILDEFNPDMVIGTGGYVCGPMVRAAHKKGIPTYIHEQNAFPGMTNKMLEKYVDRVFLAFREAGKYFKRKEKLVVTGNPIRKQFLTAGVVDYRKKLGIDKKDFVLLCFGGSRGAGRINSSMLEIIPALNKEPGMRIVFITGKAYHDKIRSKLKEQGVDLANGKVTLLPYADNIHEYMFAADLIVSRSGALTISEITACGKASILIPSPNVTGNHQYFNAKVVADRGGAVLMEESELSSEKLIGTILRLKINKEILNRMSQASLQAGKTDAVDIIYDNLQI